MSQNKEQMLQQSVDSLVIQNAELKQKLEHNQILLNTYCDNLEVHKATIESLNLRVADLEAVEKMRDEEIASLREAHGTALVERDALQARIAESVKQEPVAYVEHHKGGDNLTWERIDLYYAKATPLYAHPFIPPAGMMLVPVEPTDEMINAGDFRKHRDAYEPEADCYKAMLKAYSEAPKEK